MGEPDCIPDCIEGSVIVVHPHQAKSQSAAHSDYETKWDRGFTFTHTHSRKSTKECTFSSHEP